MKVCLLGLENLPVLAEEYSAFYSGGEQVQQTLLAKALRRRGYDVSMVVADYGQRDGETWEGIRTYKAFRFDAGIPVIRFVYPRWVKLWGSLKRANAQVYYTSCAGMHVGLLALFCKKYHRGLVFRLASDGDVDPERLMIRYRRDKLLYQYGLRRAHCVLAQHKGQQSRLKSNYAVRSTIAGLLVEAPARLVHRNQKDIDILWVSNLQPVKRPELFLELARKMPHRRFSMVGGRMVGASGLYERMRREAASIPNLVFHGAIPYRDIGYYFDRARVLVNTSSLEGFPNTYLQSWLRGVPVISFFDPEGLIARKGLGMTVNTLGQMEEVVESLLKDDSRWQALSEKVRSYATRHFDENNVVAAYCRAIETAWNKAKTSDAT